MGMEESVKRTGEALVLAQSRALIYDIIAGYGNGSVTGVELGVRRASLTTYLLANFPNLSLIAVDLWAESPEIEETHPHEENYRKTLAALEPFGDRAKILRMLTTEAAGEVEDKSVDFVYIDATHTFEAVSAELRAWLPKIKADGWIMGHDYCADWAGVKLAVDEYCKNVQVAATTWACRKRDVDMTRPVSVVLDFDDFHQTNHRLDLLWELRERVKGFKVNLFTVPGRCVPRWLEDMQAVEWIDLLPHGWKHANNYEFAKVTESEGLEYLGKIEPLGLTKCFKAPGWQISRGMYAALNKRGYVVAEQWALNPLRPPGLRCYALDGGPEKRVHGHIGNVCGNGIEEQFEYYASLRGRFEFIRDVIGERADKDAQEAACV